MKYILLALLVSLISCKKKVEKEANHFISVDVDKAGSSNISETAKIVDIVSLELTDNSLIKEISKIYVTGQYILIIDLMKSEMCLFNKSDGKFIRNIGVKGRGPGEYTMLNDVFYDETTELIYAHERIKRNMQIYNLNGGLINELPCKYWFKGFCKNKDGFWVYSCYLDENSEGYALMLLNDSLTDRIKGFLPQKRFFTSLEGTRFIKDINNAFYFIYPFSNIVYQLDNSGPKPYFQIDFGSKTLPYKKIQQMSDPKEYDNLKSQSYYLADIVNPLINNNKFYFSFSYISGASTRYSAVYNLSKQNTEVFSSFRKYLPPSSSGLTFESITFMEPIGVYRDELIYLVRPDDLSDDDFSLLKENVSDSLDRDSNPILFFVKEI